MAPRKGEQFVQGGQLRRGLTLALEGSVRNFFVGQNITPFSTALRLAFAAVCLASAGFLLVLLAMWWHARVLLVLGFVCAVVGIFGGICAIFYGWWCALARSRGS